MKIKTKPKAQPAKELEIVKVSDQALAATPRAQEEEQAKKEAAPDKQKIMDFAEYVLDLEVPSTTSKRGKEVEKEIREKVVGFANWVKKMGATL